MWINYVTWSPKSDHIAFTLRSAAGPNDPPRGPLRLWVADVATRQARELPLPGRGINAIFDDYCWLNDDEIVACVIPRDSGPAPQRPPVPPGPKIQSNETGRTSQARTYPDLLKARSTSRLPSPLLQAWERRAIFPMHPAFKCCRLCAYDLGPGSADTFLCRDGPHSKSEPFLAMPCPGQVRRGAIRVLLAGRARQGQCPNR